jgi:Protein of unknown function (DUF2804)
MPSRRAHARRIASETGPSAGGQGLPWRGPGAGRPELPLPPGPMPLRAHGQNRKRWRYVGVFGEEVMLCAARAHVGPLGQSFWVLWDRRNHERLTHTSFRPGSGEVTMDGPRLEIGARRLRASLRLGEGEAIESICPSGSGWGWTRKRAGVPVVGTIEAGDRRWQVDALAVDDESAGYHRRHTSWRWSAGVGTAGDGRAVAWNLVEGINDPPRDSERAIWVDGMPHEPAPVSFQGEAGIEFADGSRLCLTEECERARNENLLLVSSRYRHRFCRFRGALDGLDLREGLGVVEDHDARW